MSEFKWCDNCQLCTFSRELKPTLQGVPHWFCDKHKKEMTEEECVKNSCINFEPKGVK